MLNTGNLAVMSDGLRNAAQALDNFSMDNNYMSPNLTLTEHTDFTRDNEDLVFHWYEGGDRKELSLKTINDFLNGGVMLQINQLLETVANLEEKIEAMEYYNDNDVAA